MSCQRGFMLILLLGSVATFILQDAQVDRSVLSAQLVTVHRVRGKVQLAVATVLP